MKAKFVAALLAASALPSLASAQAMPDPIAYDDHTITSAFIDRSIDPGDDFFDHANNALLEDLEILPNLPAAGLGVQLYLQNQAQVRGLFDEAVAANAPKGTITQKVADTYVSFSDVAGIDARGMAPVTPYLDRIAAVKTMDELVELWGDPAYRTPINTYLTIDRNDPNVHRIGIGAGRYLLPVIDNYLEENDRNAKMQADLVAYATEVLAALGKDEAARLASDILAFETEMARRDWGRTLERKVLLTWNPMSQADAVALAGDFPLATFLSAEGIPSDQIVNIAKIPPTAKEMAEEPLTEEEYAQSRRGFPALMAQIADTPLETLKAWTALHFVSRYHLMLPDPLRTRTETFYDIDIAGSPQPVMRDLKLGGTLDSAIGEGVGQLFVERYFSPEAKALATEMIENVRTAMRLNLEELDWMGDDTRAQALEKLSAITPKVGYPDKFETYDGVDIVADDPLANMIEFARFNHRDTLERLVKPVDRSRWYMTPQTINAYYSGSLNEIVFPAAFLMPPFFGVDRDPAANYGAVGMVIGHEIGHGFDERGSRFDADGRQRNWWTEEDRKRFEARAARLIEQYDANCPFEDACVSGALTLGENIGDLGGLAIAYRAYKLSLGGKEAPVIDGLTGDQRFFLAHAQNWGMKMLEGIERQRLQSDEHSPNKARVNEVVRNFDPWYAAFNVTPDDDLYLAPEERVRIWN